MPNQNNLSVQNNFIAGFKTEYTGLNFPENAATSTSNTVYTLTGDVVRRGGFNFETNFTTDTVNRAGLAMSTYKWNNVGGDGSTQLIVRQIGNTLYFYLASSATIASPLSTQQLVSSINFTAFQAQGNVNTIGISECTYADGNGYLFVYHKDCDPFYCNFTPGTISTATVAANKITLQTRDFFGIYPEPGNPAFTARPTTLSNFHRYNLQNQGWTANSLWSTSQTVNGGMVPSIVNLGDGQTIQESTGVFTFTVDASIAGVNVGQAVTLNFSGSLTYENGGQFYTQGFFINGAQGSINSYSGSSMVINVGALGTGTSLGKFVIPQSSPGIVAINNSTVTISVSSNINTIQTWFTAIANFPSNADVWWRFKNTSDVFAPAPSTIVNTTLPNSPAPNGSFIFPVFNQNRTALTSLSGLTSISTTARPTNGAFHAGRVWYTGVNASQAGSGELSFYTWTENIYFSQIIENASQFGYCYQANDPTDETFFDLLPTDGGVITIQGSGAIYKLFPVQNGLLVFAANGVWFITGSQGIGFQANDYTVTKVPASPLITSGTSFVNVQGWPLFWNEEGIYMTSIGQSGSIQFQNIAVGTILTYYSNIPLQSKKFARGDYSQVDYIIEWCFRSTNESSVTDRYQFDTILALNTVNKAFYIYNLPAGTPYIHSVNYVAGPGGSTSPSPTFKYLTSFLVAGPTYHFTWSEENDFTRYKDWFSFDSVGINFVSKFATAYKLEGKAVAKWQPTYTYVFLRNGINNSYKIQGLWEFATAGNSGKWSTVQVINDTTNTTNFGMVYHRHKIRGRGLVLQLQFTSVDGKPFDIMGWSVWENINTGP